MNKEEQKFEDFFTKVTGITNIDDVEFSPDINTILTKKMDIRKTIGNINLIQGNIRSIPEAENIINEFLSVEIP